MFTIIATGTQEDVQAAWTAIAWADPCPAGAVDAKEEGRTQWRLDAFTETQGDVDAIIALITDISPALHPRVEEVVQQDWVTLSLEGLPPVEAGQFIVVGSHALAATSPGKTAILIEAGPAFGTGHHGTTLGCLLGLQHVMRTKVGRVLDLGTGSGVLAIAALKVGADFAIGTDIDPQSVIVARDNAVKNNVAAKFRAYTVPGTRLPRIRASAPYDTVFANILARPLVKLAPEIFDVTADGGAIILSGLLHHQEPQVRGAFAGHGLVLEKRFRKDGWSTLLFRKPKKPAAISADAGPVVWRGARRFVAVAHS